MATIATPDTCKAVLQDAAIKIAIDDLSHVGAEEAVFLSKLLVVRRRKDQNQKNDS